MSKTPTILLDAALPDGEPTLVTLDIPTGFDVAREVEIFRGLLAERGITLTTSPGSARSPAPSPAAPAARRAAPRR